MAVLLEELTSERINTLRNLFELAAYDLSELSGLNINDEGQYVTNLNFDEWLEDPNYTLLFIRVEGELAGFIVIKYLKDETLYYLNHFFILRKFRRKNIGKVAALKAFDLYEGKWRVSEFDWNEPAQIFWNKVIKEYTNGQYIENRRKDDKGPAQEFTNHHRKYLKGGNDF